MTNPPTTASSDAKGLSGEARPKAEETPKRNAETIAQRARRLLIREEVLGLLHLTDDQVQHLINTRQIMRIRIAGEERFDSRDIDGLIDSYKATAQRSAL
ncbi:MAG TPA: hypothetical protein VGG85_02470 [Terracidiphilus sp.]|jgi:hypothetical protein